MSTFSPNLRIELINSGDQAGVWGTTTNTNLGTLVEDAISGYTTVSITGTNQALTALNGAADQSRNMTLALTTTTGAPFNVYAPPAEKTYIIQNASAFAATLFNSTVLGNTTAAGAGVTIPAGRTITVWSDGTNFAFQNNHLAGLTLATDLAIADGGTGASDAAGARSNLGLGTMATQAANNVAITGGSITGITDLAVADGGTGASDAAGARANLDVPSRGGADASGTWGINISGTAAAATSPASGGSFITSSNIGSQSVNFANSATNAAIANSLTANALAQIYPVGSIYINADTTTNPATLLGFGTWVAFGAGRVLLGLGALAANTFNLGDTGGVYDATLVSHNHTGSTGGQSQSHTHSFSGTTATAGAHAHSQSIGTIGTFGTGLTVDILGAYGGVNANATADLTQNAGLHSHAFSGSTSGPSLDHAHGFTTDPSGSSATNANLQPYVTVAMWRRTA